MNLISFYFISFSERQTNNGLNMGAVLLLLFTVSRRFLCFRFVIYNASHYIARNRLQVDL